MKAYIFPGQGSQFKGMGENLYNSSSSAKVIFQKANELLGYAISDIMFHGTDEQIRETKVTQLAIFIYSIAQKEAFLEVFTPTVVAGHSLGELTALVASEALSFEAGLRLVQKRATVMQSACEAHPSSMAAIIALPDEVVKEVCSGISEGIVVPANYNAPGQVVISGETPAVEKACEQLKEKGAKRALLLNVGGAFHSPLMDEAKEAFEDAILSEKIISPRYPIYQNVTAEKTTDPSDIKKNLIEQMTSPVRWTQTIENMSKSGIQTFIEVGPGKVLEGLGKKIAPSLKHTSIGHA